MLSGGEEESGSINSGSYFENSAAAFQLSGVFALIEIDIHKKSTSTNDVEVLCAVKLRKYAQKEKTPKYRGSVIISSMLCGVILLNFSDSFYFFF